jgi:hypothetical protein
MTPSRGGAFRHCLVPLSARATRRRCRSTGQGLVEFALVFPILLLLLVGIVDMGRFVYTANVLSQAAREAARVASVEASWIGKTTTDDPGCVLSAALITGSNPGAHVCPKDSPALRLDALAAAQATYVRLGGSILGGTIDPTSFYLRCDDPGTGAPTNAWTSGNCSANNTTQYVVSVRIVYTYVPLTPIISSYIKPTLSSAASMVIN